MTEGGWRRSAAEPRDRLLQIRLTESEQEAIKALASEAGQTVSAYVLEEVLGRPKRPAKPRRALRADPERRSAERRNWVSPHREELVALYAAVQDQDNRPMTLDEATERERLLDAIAEFETGSMGERPAWVKRRLPTESRARKYPRTSVAWDHALRTLAVERVRHGVTDSRKDAVGSNSRQLEELRNLMMVCNREDLLQSMTVQLPGERRKRRGTGEDEDAPGASSEPQGRQTSLW